MAQIRPLRVFLCHASQDKPAVWDLYSILEKQDWIDPWLDEVKLLPGMDWDYEIDKALREADNIIVCLSKESIAKEGYVQKEFKRAFSYAEEKPEGAIYIIPLRLDDCRTPLKFQQWQWVDYFKTNAQDKLLQTLHLRATNLGILPTNKSFTLKPESRPISPYSVPLTSNFHLGEHTTHTFGGLEFVRIPARDFYMGADDIDDSRPQHLVYQLAYDYYMTRFTVTNQQYAQMAREKGAPVILSKKKSQHPVVNISWYSAQKFIEWLNKNHQSELPTGYHFCLPSEAEWEKAARGPDGNEYPWGDKFDKNNCNTKESGKNGITPVGTYSPRGDSPYGCADMTGNVWEWTRSLWGKETNKLGFEYPYQFNDSREDENANKSVLRILRGGSFLSDELEARCAFRGKDLPSFDFISIGFRVAVSPFHLVQF